MPDDRPVNRRNFFRQGLKEFLRPLAQNVGEIEKTIRQISSMDDEAAHAAAQQDARKAQSPPRPAPLLRPAPSVWHRPPGALAEQSFRDTCSRCGDCVKVCPAQCIQIDSHGVKGAGLPYIDVDAAACVLCSGLKCMHVCPTGALQPLPLADIDMGTAVWHEDLCLRSKGQNCTICVDHCPVGEMALQIDPAGKVKVHEDHCTGCGVCQHDCPTNPKSITVTPKGGAGPVARARR